MMQFGQVPHGNQGPTRDDVDNCSRSSRRLGTIGSGERVKVGERKQGFSEIRLIDEWRLRQLIYTKN